MCPAGRAKEGARLLGIRQEDGTVAILPETLPITQAFIDLANKDSPAEQRFRFTNVCLKGGCVQWNGQGCDISDVLVQHVHGVFSAAELPVCGIRSNCRWHLQNGANACRVCPLVITEITEEEVREFERTAQMP